MNADTDDDAVRRFLERLVERSNKFIRARHPATTPTGVLRPAAVATLIAELPDRLANMDAGNPAEGSASATELLLQTAARADGDETLLAWLVHDMHQHGLDTAILRPHRTSVTDTFVS